MIDLLTFENALIVLISAVLYRVPRGTKFPWWGSYQSATAGRVIYAFTTAFMIEPSLWGLVIAAWLWLAVVIVESKDADYGPQPEARKGSSFWKLEIWGWVTLVPLFGVINYATYGLRDKLPRLHKHLTGWSEYAELGNGALRAASTILGTLTIRGLAERLV